MSDKEYFNSPYPYSDFGGPGDISEVLPGDNLSEGGMSNLDDLDGTGSGPMGSAYPKYDKMETTYPDLSGGKPDGSLETETVCTKNEEATPKLADYTLGVPEQPVTQKSTGVVISNTKAQSTDYGEIDKPYTYYYLENDNINKPCKTDADCGGTKCSEAGFCRY